MRFLRGWYLAALVALAATAAWGSAVCLAIETYRMTAGLAGVEALSQLGSGAQATVVYDRHGRVAFTFYTEQRIDVPLARVSPALVAAVLAAEDRRFFSHHGLDPIRIAGAALANLRVGRIVQGGSTITQQLARSLELDGRRLFRRKLRESMLAAMIEERYPKDDILETYLNRVYFGAGYYGVEAAARGYFGKTAAELDAAKAALLAGLIKAPSALAPDVAPAAALARRNVVLEAMRETGAIDAAAFERAIRTPLDVRPRRAAWSAAAHDAAGRPCGLYFQEEVRRWLVARFGERQVLEGGLHVRTGYDPALQLEAERAIGGRIVEIARQRRAARDLQGALVALDAATGDVRALVGGRDFHASPFNRATQARRQAGSAFKPIVFAAALERGFAPGTLLGELERPYGATPAGWWPSGDHEAAQYTLRRALKVSSNRASARLLELVGLPATLDYARRLGIESALPAVPSLALGTGEVTLLELTSAYGTFANRGLHADPVLIQRVEDARGRTLWEAPRGQYPILSVTTAYLMSSMLSDVIGGGTGYRARSAGFKRPAAGKTGTTDGFTDAWFIGYTPRLVAGVWFGLDQPAPIMHEGFAGVVAVPAWARFMKAATAGDPPDWYEMPGDIERVAICRTSGARAVDACRLALLPVGSDANVLAWLNGQAPLTPAQPHGVYEDLYPVGSAPVETCPVHGPVSPLRVIGPG